MGPVTNVVPVLDCVAQMNTFTSFVSMLSDPGAKDENKLKAAQELSENLEVIVSSPQYPLFLDHAVKNFLKILQENEPVYIAEYNIQLVRKLILEMFHRLPTNEHLRPYVKQLLNLMFRLLERENEDNVLICLRVIIELHKQYRPQYSVEIQAFLQFVKGIYRDLPNQLNKIFEPKVPIKVKELSELSIEAVLSETFTATVVLTESRTPDGNNISYNLIPKGVLSLKVLQELPIIVVLMYQLYKHNVHQDVAEFIPLIMTTISLQPSTQHKSNPGFNKEIFVDFIGAQIKTLSFLAYIIRIYQEAVTHQAGLMVKGILGLLSLCPMEVAHLRKELLIASRHILATDLRLHFIPHMEHLFDENLLFGKGWTTNESLRPLAYSTLADLVHHVRQHLPMLDLARAVHLFSKNVHDESLPTSIQTMSCKLLLNLVECIRQRSDVENGPGRELLIEMLEVFVLKFKSIVKLQLPSLMGTKNKADNPNAGSTDPPASPSLSWSQTGSTGTSSAPDPSPSVAIEPKHEDVRSSLFFLDSCREEKEKMSKLAVRASPPQFSITECRSLVKTLVCGVKTITWGCAACKTPMDATTNITSSGKNLQPKETAIFIRLVHWAMKALDVYALNIPNTVGSETSCSVSGTSVSFPASVPSNRQTVSVQTIRSKEEKEVLEHFAGVFAMMNPQTFKEVFATTIDYVVERIYRNSALQVVANSFLANPSTSAVFATILVEYLLNHMEEMGVNMERSNLYLKLFKLVFGSVSLFAAENEQMLKPHLPHIVNKSMELALSAKEPYNYFLLLRALFRSIGGGSHDLLYQEFLPLLPNLLQSLNSLQSGLHKQHMKDLFVELCLTVPVRLSSLLPYLPMLMDPLVSSLNGSQTLVSQGLRTLELCVDNLQPDFLYEHIQPVRAELMQALWRTLRNPNDQIAHVAFRVLGKFGGGNRKMMVEPQRLDFWDRDSGPCIVINFQELKHPVSLPVEKIMDTAFSALKSSSTEPFYRTQCWEVVRCFLLSSLHLDDDRLTVQRLLSHSSFLEGDVHPVQSPSFQCSDKPARHVHQTAVTAMFVAAAIKELRQAVLPTMVSLVRHYTLVAVVQQAGPFPLLVPGRSAPRVQGMDPLVLVDALATIMGHEEKELCKPGHLALVLMLDTASIVLGSKERACKLPLMEYLAERMCSLCYDRAWYAKLGGCIAIKFLFERMAFKWVLEHQYVFLKALLFVMMDLTGEVSSGAVDMAKANLEKMLLLCATPITESPSPEILCAQKKSLHDVTHELVRQVTSPNSTVREQAMHLLQVLARITNQTPTAIMEPHKEVLADMIPPKKHLLRHQPVNAQIGLMDGNTFCTTLRPRLFTIDLNIVEHKVFFHELLSLCEVDDTVLLKLPCYKSVNNLTPLRKSALQALAACHYITQCRDKILNVIFKALSCNNAELQETAFSCMKKILTGTQIEMDTVHTAVRPLLLLLGDYRSLSTNVILRLSHTTQLFPHVFNEKLCEQLLQHLRKWLEVVIVAFKTGGNRPVASTTSQGVASSSSLCSNEVKVAIGIIELFHQIPAASAKFLDILCKLILQTERALGLEPGSPFREPLLKFLLRYPTETMDLLLRDDLVADADWNRFLEHFVRYSEGKPFRDAIKANTSRLINFVLGGLPPESSSTPTPTATKPHALQVTIRILRIIIRKDDEWISDQSELIAVLTKAWCSGRYDEKKPSGLSISERKEQRQLAKILLHYFQLHPEEVELLFHLMRALCERTIPDFYFLKEFLDKTVGQSYGSDWKRASFFKFVDVFRNPSLSQELKAKILQHIIIPGFAISFERGEGEMLIGTPPTPDQDNNDSVVSVFINKVIDPDNPFGTSDAVRILLLQLSCLLVEQASHHIHDAANKRQGNKLRRLMTFAWPCLLSKNCVDPTTRYHGHLLLSHIIAKFAIHKRIVLQVFHSLLKAHAVEARNVVRQALEILTPAMPLRMEDGNTMLTHWTKKIIVEEGHTIAQLVHILQLLVRHYKVYYPVRHHLVQYMVTSIQRLGFTPTATLEHKKLAVELAEVVLKWELQRMKDEADSGGESCDETNPSGSLKRQANEGVLPEPKKPRLASSSSGKMLEVNKPIEKTHCDAIANFLLRLACQVNDATSSVNNSGEQLSKRCVALLKMALKPDVWPHCELKLAWFDRLFQTADNSSASVSVPAGTAASGPNFTNICTALDLLTFLLNILRKEQILAGFKPLQRGLSTLMSCNNSKVIRCLHGLLSRLMSVFPTEPTNSNVASKHEELEGLYAAVTKAIYEGLGAYERNTAATSTSLLGTLMLLKAACTNNPCYIDRLITSFMRALQRMTREHLMPAASGDRQPAATSSVAESGFSSCELLILSLDLVKNRVGVMGVEMRKAFIGSILVGLLEKSTESKVVRSIVRMLDEWMRTKTPIAINQGPSLREKSILLVKMMQCLEKRFPEDADLNIAFLELINFVYCEESLKGSELVSKLEPAFLAGLRCPQPSTRAKFFQVLDTSMRRRLHDRLLYIVCSQNWEAISAHYWIKQCLELVLVTSVSGTPIHIAPASGLLPGITSVIATADANERESFTVVSNIKEEPEELLDVFAHVKEDDIDMDLSNAPNDPLTPPGVNKTGLATLVNRQIKFLESGREVTSAKFLVAVGQLAHMDTSLAESLWLDLFPRIWKVLGERQQQALSVELVPFLCSGAHVIQKDCQPSAINTFAEALSLCNPPIRIKPCLLKYLGKSHNLWHRMTLMLEQLAFSDSTSNAAHTKVKLKELGPDYETEPGVLSQQETLDALSEMYSTLKEEDLWSGLWQRRAHLNETIVGVAFEQQGFFEQAQGTYELAMTKARQEFTNSPAPVSLQSEYRLLEEHWIRCGKELNQWELLQEFGCSPECLNYQLVLESAWRTPNWVVVRDALTQLEQACPKEYAWKVNLYRGFLAMCHPEEQHPNMVERYVELASSLCIREWRRLPAIVSHVHLTTLQAAQQVVELQEAAQIHQGLLQSRPGTVHDVKAIVKTWRNRLPVIADDLSHWSDVFTWRQHHYQFIVSHYDQQSDQQASAQSMLGVHASAQAIIHFGKVARKHGLTGVCLDSLARIYSIPSVPIVDCFQKIRQQVKCYLQAANVLGKNELQEGLEVIESTNLKYFAKEMTAELYALKGMLLAQIGRADDANKAFSAAVQMHDTLVKAWALWGDHLEQVFTKDSRNVGIGVSAITCFLHACRHQNESKSRKYLAKVLWLLTYDDEKLSLAESLDKYCVGIPPVQWLPWIPQLLVCLVRDEGKLVLNLLSQVGRMFPQAVYFPIRTLYLTLKIEQRERYKSAELAASLQPSADVTSSNSSETNLAPPATSASSTLSSTPLNPSATTTVATPTPASTLPAAVASSPSTPSPAAPAPAASTTSTTTTATEGLGPIKATEPMWRCSRIMHMQRDLHPTVLSSLEGIVDQMVWFRENWYEEVLRQLRQGLAKCYAIAFENRGSVAEATITPHTLSFVKKLVATFGIGIENIANSASGSFSSAASESLARRAQATAQDPVFQRMKTQFSTDFDFTLPGAMKLHNLIHKLKKWIKILEAKTKLLPRSFLIEEKCRFLSNFNLQTAEVELPGEFLLPKHTHYYVRIARFLPRVEIVQKHNTAARRLYIRGHNGKIYPYLVVNDAGLGDARREERVLQLLRMLNNYLNKHKETSKRFLNFTVPRVVAVSPQMRLVEDNPSSVTLLDVYRQRCVKRNVEHDMPIAKYYERLATIQARGSQASHQVLRDIHKDVQQIMVPRTLLREWASATFQSATFYWTFRKMLTLQMALVNLAEYVLHLTRLNADMLYIHQDSGLLSVSYFKFDVEDLNGELDANRPVPFRLTPNMVEFLTMIGVGGPLTASMIAAARCLVQPSAKVSSILKAVLRDEMISWHKKKTNDEKDKDTGNNGQVEGEILISLVNKAVNAIINRLQGLSTFDGNESKVSTLVAAANSNDNLCRMDPAWHPWL